VLAVLGVAMLNLETFDNAVAVLVLAILLLLLQCCLTGL